MRIPEVRGEVFIRGNGLYGGYIHRSDVVGGEFGSGRGIAVISALSYVGGDTDVWFCMTSRTGGVA